MLKKYLTPLIIIFFVQTISVFLMALGIIPKEVSLFLCGLLLFYFIFSPIEDSLVLFIASIPLFLALPITESFDSMASWRPLLSALFVVWLIGTLRSLGLPKPVIPNLYKYFKTQIPNLKSSSLLILTLIFLGVGALSLINAPYLGIGVKKFLFLINVFMLCVMVVNVAKKRKVIFRLLKAGVVAGALTVIVGYTQLVSVFIYPLHTFWQWWTNKVIPLFYGQAMGELLSHKNTWFSYYADKPPTLRMFSVFPDSHSFGLFCILSLPFVLSLTFWYFSRNKKHLSYLLAGVAILVLAGIIFSGSRGMWLAAICPLFLGDYLYFRKVSSQKITRLVILSFVIFFLLFPIVSLIHAQSQKIVLKEGPSLVFERAGSIINVEELSNQTRLEIWQKSLNSISQHPILGVGVGNYPVVLGQDISTIKQGASAHNLYLDIASEMGIFALVVVLAIFWQILVVCWKIFRLNMGRLEKPSIDETFATSFGFYLIWILGYSFFDVVLLNDKVFLFFMVGIGILYSIKNLRIKEGIVKI